MKKYNYVYRITNKILNKHYYGVRGCNVEPKRDLGVKYFSSSTDKEFRNDQKNYPENYKFKIVRICSTRKEADKLEIKLQEKFNVGKSESFYNRAKRTSMGFSTAGTNLSPEHKQKLSEAKQNMSDETKQKMSEAQKGVPKSDETRKKMSEAKTGENNPMFGKELSPETKLKISEAKIGVPVSDETRKKMSEAQKGENHPMFGKEHTPETRQKMSEAKQNMSDETRKKMSEAHKGVPQEQVECPHCGKIGGIGIMKRWHFDNCKYKESEEFKEC